MMRMMGWSWNELQATPEYVRIYCYDFLGMQSEYARQQQRKVERAQAQQTKGWRGV